MATETLKNLVEKAIDEPLTDAAIRDLMTAGAIDYDTFELAMEINYMIKAAQDAMVSVLRGEMAKADVEVESMTAAMSDINDCKAWRK